MKRLSLFPVILLFVILLGSSVSSHAQCSMCRQVAESNLKQGANQRGKGLNTAILYLMSVPYVMGGVGGYLLWKNRKK